MEHLKILVKVGKSAKTVLRNCKAIRAITVNEMKYYLQNESIDLLIVEDIASQDCDNALDIIKEYIKEGNQNKVWFNADGADENTLGLADELNCDILDNTIKIWEAIENRFNVYVGRDISKIAKELNGASLNSENCETSGTFDFSVDMSQYIEEDVILPDIKTKSDIEEFNDTTVKQIIAEQRRKIDRIRAQVNGETDNFEDKDESEDWQEDWQSDNPFNDNQPDNELKGQINTGFMLTQVNKLNETVERLNKKIESMQSRLAKEVELRGAIQEERDSLKVRLVNIIDTKKVVEENVPATEYRKIISKYNEVQEKLEEFTKNSLKDSDIQKSLVNGLKDEITELKAKLEDKESEINSLNDSLAKSNETENENSAALQALVDSLKNKLEKTQLELEKANKTVEELEEKVKEDADYLRDFDNIKHKANVAEKASIMHRSALAEALFTIREYSTSNYNKDKNIEDLNETIESLKLDNSSLSDTINNKDISIEKLNTIVGDLNEKLKEAEQNVEIRTSELQTENNKLRTKMISADTEIKTLRNQLISKDNQYKALANSVGPTDPTTGQPKVVANLRMLEGRNKELKIQVTTLTQQLSTALAESQKAIQLKQSLVTENQNLKRSLNAYIGAGAGGQMIPLVQNGGRAKIVNVFGASSSGITSLAYTIAQKLASHSNVLLMDLDISTPKLDSYFKKQAEVKIPGIPNQTTALELFLTQGIDRVWANATVLIPQVAPNNKNGKLWWFTGLYKRLDETALLTADWNSLFKKISNSFDYIIVDCGKITGNGAHYQLVQNISKVAYRSIAISGTNFSDVRSLLSLMGNMPRNNLVYVINQILSVNDISTPVKNLLGNLKRYDIPFSQGSIGKRQSMMLDKMLRGRIEMFVNSYISMQNGMEGEV